MASPDHTQRSRLMPSQKNSCVVSSSVRALTCQMRFSSSSLQRKVPLREGSKGASVSSAATSSYRVPSAVLTKT